MLSWLIGGSQGGYTRFQILQILHESPSNANQLAKLLNMDYTTIRHHLKVLEENKMVLPIGKEYAKSYALASFVEDNYKMVEEISEAAIAKARKLKIRLFEGNLAFLLCKISLLNHKIFKEIFAIFTLAGSFCIAI